MGIQLAKAAAEAEWKRLQDKNTWRVPRHANKVIFLSDVTRESRRSGVKIHIGRMFAICYIKGSELAVDDPKRKWTGRVRFEVSP